MEKSVAMEQQIETIYEKFLEWYLHSDEFWCTQVCQWLKKNHLPDAVIMGYNADDNPTAVVGEAEGGHDFLVVDNKWIVDFWYEANYDEKFPLLLPIERAAEYYGDRSTWVESNT